MTQGKDGIVIVGCGVMGEAILSGALRSGLASPATLSVGEPNPARRRYLAERYGVVVCEDNWEAASQRRLVVIAVKPNVVAQVGHELRGRLSPDHVILSVVAGLPLGKIVELFGHAKVARAMPNIAARIGAAATVWTASEAVEPEERELIRALLAGCGLERYVEREALLEMATALSASGPAFALLILEAFVDAGVHIGLSRELAQQLTLSTWRGALALLEAEGAHPAQLRNQVTTPGGTTAEGLLKLEEAGLRAAICRAVIAAHDKAKQMRENQG